jgi:hypothetical protein
MYGKLEARAYGPSSTPAEIAAIKERIYPYRGDILMYRELPVQSVFHLDLFEQRLNELGSKMRSYDLLIDLTEAQFPGADVRARLKKLFLGQKNLRRIAVFTGRNFLINTAAKFVLSEPTLKFSVHTLLEQALAALR